MTIKQIQKELDKLGVDYNKGEKKAYYEKLLAKQPVDPNPEPEKPEGNGSVEGPKEPRVEPKPPVEAEKTPGLPIYDHRQVLEVMNSGHSKTHFHCRMEGGVTMHVPRHLFR